MRRSLWPNIPRDELTELVERWAEREDADVRLIWEGAETADDRIAREAADIDGPYWLITSDRGLRERVAAEADRAAWSTATTRPLTTSTDRSTARSGTTTWRGSRLPAAASGRNG